jgi:hypothetical protein
MRTSGHRLALVVRRGNVVSSVSRGLSALGPYSMAVRSQPPGSGPAQPAVAVPRQDRHVRA